MSKNYKRKIGVERSMLRAPSYMVSMRARIIGHIPDKKFEKAVQNARKRHPFLGVRVVFDEDSKFDFKKANYFALHFGFILIKQFKRDGNELY